jgi:hypothetical protein
VCTDGATPLVAGDCGLANCSLWPANLGGTAMFLTEVVKVRGCVIGDVLCFGTLATLEELKVRRNAGRVFKLLMSPLGAGWHNDGIVCLNDMR